MSQAVSKEAVERVLNLSLQIKGNSVAENRKATAIELFGRASALEEAIRTLGNQYSYEITTDDPKKIAARKQLGGMSREVLVTVRDELISAGVREWREYEAISNLGEGSDSSTTLSSPSPT